MTDPLHELKLGILYHFSDWPVSAVPRVAAGVYTVWNHDKLIYVGMSGQGGGASKEAVKRARERGKTWGLRTRLASHASGRRSGDQFCVYIADRLVLGTLTADEIHEIGTNTLSLDQAVKRYIHEHLSFRFIETDSGAEALSIEEEIKKGCLGQKPFLNPLD